MLAHKRKRTQQSDDESDSGASSSHEVPLSDDEIDISSALTGKKARTEPHDEENDDELTEFIQNSIAKRNVKGGTEVLKKTKGKGKTKMSKGEVGGGSFQSMGECLPIPRSSSRIISVFCRPEPIAATIIDAPGLPDTHSHSTALYTSSFSQSSSRSCGYGSYRLR